MPKQTVDVSACLPGEPAINERIRIKINGVTYDIWAEWNGSVWVVSLTSLSGASICDLTACIPGTPNITTTYVVNGVDYHYSTSDNRWHCGAA